MYHCKYNIKVYLCESLEYNILYVVLHIKLYSKILNIEIKVDFITSLSLYLPI